MKFALKINQFTVIIYNILVFLKFKRLAVYYECSLINYDYLLINGIYLGIASRHYEKLNQFIVVGKF